MGGNLFGGQQQQFAIARAVNGISKALLLAEQTEGMQPNRIDEIVVLLRRVAAELGWVKANGASSELTDVVVSRLLSV